MEFGSVLIVILIFFLSGFIILRPFFVNSNSERRAGSTMRDALVADRERLLHSIEELDLEFELKKISSKEHTRNRDILLTEAVKVLKELDNLPKSSAKKRKSAAPVQAGDDLENMITDRRKQLKSDISTKCPHCGEAVDKGTQFCSQCGGAL